MNSNDLLRNYKHDITGKFRDISTAVSTLNDESLKSPEGLEILEAVHEVLIKMVKTSELTIKNVSVIN